MSQLARHLEAAVKAPREEDAVAELVAAWVLFPSTRIAKICRAVASLTRAEGLDGSQSARETAWHELAKRDGRAAIDRLLLTAWSRSAKDARRRLEVLRSFGPDPRVVGALLSLDDGERFLNSEGNRFWTEAYELLLSWGSAEAAQRIQTRGNAAQSTSPLGPARALAVFEPLTVRWQSKWPREHELPAELDPLLRALETRSAPKKALLDGLLQAVIDAPEDDRPRLVWADALAEQGDARGEFISLQFVQASGAMTLGQREKMQRLLSGAGASWFDGLEGQIAPVAVFSRGTVSEVRLSTRAPDPANRAWRLVETIDLGGLALGASGFLSHPHLSRVHSLRSMSDASFVELCRAGPERAFQMLELESVGEPPAATPKWTAQVLRIKGFVDQSAWWWQRSGLTGVVTWPTLVLNDGFERIGQTFARLTHDRKYRGVRFTAGQSAWPEPLDAGWSLEFRGGDDHALHVDVFDESKLGALEQALTALPERSVVRASVTCHLKRAEAWRQSFEARLAAALGPQRLRDVPVAYQPRAPNASPVVVRSR